jgi:hypothetical protein
VDSAGRYQYSAPNSTSYTLLGERRFRQKSLKHLSAIQVSQYREHGWQITKHE